MKRHNTHRTPLATLIARHCGRPAYDKEGRLVLRLEGDNGGIGASPQSTARPSLLASTVIDLHNSIDTEREHVHRFNVQFRMYYRPFLRSVLESITAACVGGESRRAAVDRLVTRVPNTRGLWRLRNVLRRDAGAGGNAAGDVGAHAPARRARQAGAPDDDRSDGGATRSSAYSSDSGASQRGGEAGGGVGANPVGSRKRTRAASRARAGVQVPNAAVRARRAVGGRDASGDAATAVKRRRIMPQPGLRPVASTVDNSMPSTAGGGVLPSVPVAPSARRTVNRGVRVTTSSAALSPAGARSLRHSLAGARPRRLGGGGRSPACATRMQAYSNTRRRFSGGIALDNKRRERAARRGGPRAHISRGKRQQEEQAKALRNMPQVEFYYVDPNRCTCDCPEGAAAASRCGGRSACPHVVAVKLLVASHFLYGRDGIVPRAGDAAGADVEARRRTLNDFLGDVHLQLSIAPYLLWRYADVLQPGFSDRVKLEHARAVSNVCGYGSHTDGPAAVPLPLRHMPGVVRGVLPPPVPFVRNVTVVAQPAPGGASSTLSPRTPAPTSTAGSLHANVAGGSCGRAEGASSRSSSRRSAQASRHGPSAAHGALLVAEAPPLLGPSSPGSSEDTGTFVTPAAASSTRTTCRGASQSASASLSQPGSLAHFSSPLHTLSAVADAQAGTGSGAKHDPTHAAVSAAAPSLVSAAAAQQAAPAPPVPAAPAAAALVVNADGSLSVPDDDDGPDSSALVRSSAEASQQQAGSLASSGAISGRLAEILARCAAANAAAAAASDAAEAARSDIAANSDAERAAARKAALLRPLGRENTELVDFVLDKDRDNDEDIARGFSVMLRRRDLLVLQPLTWLKDEVVNSYVSLLMERHALRGAAGPPVGVSEKRARPLHVWNSFFYAKLSEDRKRPDEERPDEYVVVEAGFNFDKVVRWTRRLTYYILDCGIILVPINHGNVHWAGAVLWPQRRVVAYFDSLGSADTQSVCKRLVRWAATVQAQKEDADARSGAAAANPPPLPLDSHRIREIETTWKIVDGNEVYNMPQQKNGCDCGVFMLLLLDYLALGLEEHLNWMQADILAARRNIALAIVQKRVFNA